MGPDSKPVVGFPLLKVSVGGLCVFTLMVAHSITHTPHPSSAFSGQREATDRTTYPGHSRFSFVFYKIFVIEEFV